MFYMLLILTPAITNRLRYIADLLIVDMLGVNVKLTISVDEYTGYPGSKVIYASEPIASGLFIESSALLFEEKIVLQETKASKYDDVPVLFSSANPMAALPFDIFAASFYLVSRYEEYLPHQRDRYGRFPCTESIAWKEGFLNVPIIHTWAVMFGELLLRNFPWLIFRFREYKYIPTIDIDHAYCYRCRTLTRTMGGLGRDAMHGHIGNIILRIKVLSGTGKDPYDTYAFISQIHKDFMQNPLYFVLFADDGQDDNNVTVTAESFHLLLRELDRYQRVGIHPSLSSNKQYSRLEAEYTSLSRVLNRKVTISRQHFLRLTMPKTYQSLIQLGITDDYSMGYASHPGFRAGITLPFHFFDLTSNQTTHLIIHPVSLMDVTLKDYLRLSPEESLETIRMMIDKIKSIHGEFVSLWHNESLGNTGRWKGWRWVYEEMVKLAST